MGNAFNAMAGSLDRSRGDLRESQQRFRALVHHASDVFTVIGADAVIRYRSPAIERVLGHPAKDTIGRSFLDLVGPDDQGTAMQLFERSQMQPGVPTVGEVHMRGLGDEQAPRRFEMTATDRLGDPTVRGLVLNYRDITERVRTDPASLGHAERHFGRPVMRRIVLILVVAVLLASCSDGRDSATAPAPATTQAAATGTIDGSFDAGGHKLHLRCEGTGSPGSPTIVYLHGLGGDGSDIKSINTQLTSQARVCTYDRLNVGRSDRAEGRHSGADSVRDLHALLDAAGVPGPYLLVGFSFGGLLAVMYAATYPDQVMGLVSLDGSLPTDDRVDQLIPKDEREQSSHDIELEQPELVIKEINRILEMA